MQQHRHCEPRSLRRSNLLHDKGDCRVAHRAPRNDDAQLLQNLKQIAVIICPEFEVGCVSAHINRV